MVPHRVVPRHRMRNHQLSLFSVQVYDDIIEHMVGLTIRFTAWWQHMHQLLRASRWHQWIVVAGFEYEIPQSEIANKFEGYGKI